jgi:hypothetical protein
MESKKDIRNILQRPYHLYITANNKGIGKLKKEKEKKKKRTRKKRRVL